MYEDNPSEPVANERTRNIEIEAWYRAHGGVYGDYARSFTNRAIRDGSSLATLQERLEAYRIQRRGV